MATYQDSRYNIALPSGAGGALVHIKTLTASSSATLSFVNGASDVVIDGTYKTYIFKFINIHPADATYFSVNFSDDTSSHSYDLTKTSTSFIAYNDEADTTTRLTYRTGYDLAQGSGIQPLGGDTMSNAADNGGAGELWLFNPSDTTFVKEYIATTQASHEGDYSLQCFTAGYFNTTSAIDAIQFKMHSGNIDAGTIKMYGVS